MNKFLPKLLCSLLLAVISITGFAQHKVDPADAPKVRCATDEAIQRQYQTDPAFRAMMQKREADYQAWKATHRTSLGDLQRTTLLTGPVTIPTVFHIVAPNPNLVSDADCEYVINRLNLDFSGLNPDSTNGVPFYSVRGHSLIRFCLARRDPNGNFTSGIERKIGTGAAANGIIGNEPQPIKEVARGGLDAWDNTRYYNIWVAPSSGGILGIAPAIGIGTSISDGVCVNIQSFAGPAAPSGSYPGSCAGVITAFDRGRTAVHEVGHNFGLFHTFSGCTTGADMGQLTSTGCQLPGTILGLPDDTPSQSAATSGCPTGSVASNCGGVPNPPGKQYQNYMDYTDDVCYSMFTNTQVERMHWLLENCRAGYLTSNGCQLPTGTPTLDGAISQIINPGGSEVGAAPGCAVTTYTLPTCPGPITPRVRVENRGSVTLTSVTISTTSTAGGTVSNNYPVNIAYGKSQVVVLNATPTQIGANTFTFAITQVNSAADANAANNTLAANFTLTGPSPLPRAANFVGVTTTAPVTVPTVAGFTNVTVAGTSTLVSWAGNTVGNGGNNGSIGINFYNMGSGNVRDWRSTPASFPALPNVADSIIVTFDVNYRTFTTEADRLQLFYSLDCGITWLPTTFDKAGAVLATLPASTTAYTTPTTTDWRGERVAVKNATIAAGGVIQFAFRGTSAFGNWLYLDNINIAIPVNRDMSVTTITRPNTAECTPTFTPNVTVQNNGVQTITSYGIEHRIDGGAWVVNGPFTTSIAPNATATQNLANATTTVGAHTFEARVINVTTASGTGDQNTANDLLGKPFTVRQIFTAPLVEGFENLPFPSAGWAINNPTGTFTWVRVTNAGGFGLSTNSVFVDNYNNTVVGEIDDIVAPPINTVGADSIIVTFDLAHKNFAGFDDILAVGVSNNCGATYAATGYQKQGATLATAGASTANYTAPAPNDWRKERVAIGGAALSTGSAIVLFRRVNGYGNNIFIDNINISLVFRRDIAAQAVARPNLVECTGNFTPAITIRNAGLDTIRSFTASYSINGGAAVSTNVTGVNIAPATVGTYPLTAATGLPVGTHTITMYTSNLVTHLGTGDQNPSNDTIRRTFNILGTQAAPLTQNFQGATYPPANWGVNNPDGGVTWTKATVGYNSNASATVQNFAYAQAAGGSTRVDELITPNVTYTNVDSVYLSFDLAALTKQYPGATQIPLDSLQILVSKDCGATFTSVFNKWGEDLQTVNDPNYPNTISFNPGVDNSVWKKVNLNITGAAGTSSTGLTVFFRNKSNNDNNIYIDNINLSTVTLPARLKQQGYLVFPSQNTGTFTIQHFLPPTDLRYVEVFDARGRLVYRKQYGTTGANSMEGVNITREAAGVYQVKLGYTNKVITERIVKLN